MKEKGILPILVVAVVAALVLLFIVGIAFVGIQAALTPPSAEGPAPIETFKGTPSFTPGPNLDTPATPEPASESPTQPD